MSRDDPLPDAELRLECARLAAIFSDGGDRLANAEKMYRFIRGEEVLAALREHCRDKQAALAFEAGVSECYVSRVLNGERPPSDKLLSLIGYRRVTAYEPIPAEQSLAA